MSPPWSPRIALGLVYGGVFLSLAAAIYARMGAAAAAVDSLMSALFFSDAAHIMTYEVVAAQHASFSVRTCTMHEYVVPHYDITAM